MQEELFHEDEYSALNHVVSALGGALVVGKQLFPHLKDSAAERRVLDSLNRDRDQEFQFAHVMWVLKAARKLGVHSGMAYFNRECGYGDPQPVEPEDEAAKLQRQFLTGLESLNGIASRLEKLSLPKVRGVA